MLVFFPPENKKNLRKLLRALRYARSLFRLLSIAEQANNVKRGRFSKAFQYMDRVIKEVEAEVEGE